MLREAHSGDAPALHRIDALSSAFPWRESQFANGLMDGEFGWVWACDAGVHGFALFAQVLDEVTLLNIAVEPDWRRRGLARALLAFALPQLGLRDAVRCLLEVRVGNGAAIALYRSLGFRDDGIRRHYYPTVDGGREDALLMSLALPVFLEK
jgi:ribosomal-protein-alanine N-acetyltransferase